MNDVQQIRKDIEGMEKDMSLRQIALQSGINYVTLRNIKSGKSKRITDSVKDRFEAFKKQFDPNRFVSDKAATTATAPAAAAPSTTTKKRGRKPGPKPGAKKKTAKKTAAKSTTKRVTKNTAAKKTTGRKPGRPKGKTKKTAAPPPSSSKMDFASPVLGQALDREIEIAEARLEYLRSLREIEDEFLKAVGRK